MKRILFVCTGNTCRSPMAEGVFQMMANKEGLQLDIRSAGVVAVDQSPISPLADALLQEKGFRETISSNLLTAELVNWSDLILTMTINHKQHVTMQHPDAIGKVYTLKEYARLSTKSDEQQQEQAQAISEIQIKIALGKELSVEERLVWDQLQTTDDDIVDPFGGTVEDYRRSLEEIEHSLQSLMDKIKKLD